MKKDNVEKVRAEIEKILTNRVNEMDELEDQIKNETDEIAAQEKEMSAATDRGDLKAYQAAKTSRNNATDAKEMHGKRLARLTDEPLISAEEYERLKSDIFTEMDENTAEAKKQLMSLCSQIEEIANGLRGTGIEANAVLKQLQGDIYDNRDRKRTQKGILLGRPLEYSDHYGLLGWANRFTTGDPYESLKSTEERRRMETATPDEAEEADPDAAAVDPDAAQEDEALEATGTDN